ncbi:MAG: UDP-N-acetylglucosamine--N-acetylmuramyl-(pentapeptide) pyrophosphoryl-undecaprenol N-acetylglucosamine transferase [Flavobacteriales bacterium]|nr:UDP-N-acetylglucosamine--N-acetylmuramyl-(pentapeptide) pyrophosphoryl-undecaprenol N-acetylglucosamine transferase [Flavobacteriales bacterium]
MSKKTIIISCGGTGGHIFPGTEIARSLLEKDPSLNILFIGALGKMEMKRIPNEGFSIIGLWIQGIHRNSILKNIFFPFKLIISLIQAICILLYMKPVLVIRTGGFASGPILFIASCLRMKTYIQEQNCLPGLTNKILAKYVSKIFVAYNQMEKFFPEHKILNFGNPVRKFLKTNSVSHKESIEFFGLKENMFTILVVGGSLGSTSINSLIFDIINRVDLNCELDLNDCQWIWQTGELDFDKYQFQLNKSNINSTNLSVHKFINRMDLAYHASDVVVSRSGAIAICEISYLAKHSILIPSPYVADNHQEINAQYLESQKACIKILERSNPNFKGIDRKSFCSAVIDLKTDKSKRDKIGQKANKLFKYNASKEIVNEIYSDIENK